MSGVSVTDSGPSESELDFRRIAEGGANFIARMEALQAFKSQHEIAYAKLKIGDDAGKALADAQDKQVKAKSALDEATNTLALGKKTAQDIIKQAKDQAISLVRNAQQEAERIVTEARVTRNDADGYAKQKKSDADAALARAKETEAAASRTQQEAVAALTEHQNAKAAYEKKKSDAQAVYDTLADHIAVVEHFYSKTRISVMGITNGL